MRFVLLLVVISATMGAGRWQPSTGPAYKAVPNTAVDAMSDLNKRRAMYGLPPMKTDPVLLQAAMNAASCRAALRCEGHLKNDYDASSVKYPQVVSGCGVYNMMFLSCGSDDRKQFAGAAKALGSDGKWYCHLFVKQ